MMVMGIGPPAAAEAAARRTHAHTYLNPFTVNVNGFHGKVDTNCVSVAFDKVARFEALNDTRFSRATVTDQHHFKEEIERVVGRNGH